MIGVAAFATLGQASATTVTVANFSFDTNAGLVALFCHLAMQEKVGISNLARVA